MAECLIKLGDYSQLDKFLSNDEFFHRSGWFTQVGNLLVNVRKNEKEKVCLGLSDIRMELAKSLNQVGVRFNDYHQGYYCLVKYVCPVKCNLIIYLMRTLLKIIVFTYFTVLL